MQPATQQVLNLIHAYQAAVYQAVAWLNAKSEQEKGFHWHEESPGYRAGYLDAHRRVRYAFHGTGCVVTAPEWKVDFDYAQEGGCTGIDPWFLFDFLRSNPAGRAAYPLLTKEENVAHGLQVLAQAGVLARFVHSEDDRRYYVAADLQNPHPPTVTLHWPEGE